LGIIPAENSTKVFDDNKPFAEALSKQLGVPVRLTVGTNYTATIEALSSGKIDVAWFGPFSYVLAADKYNAEAFGLILGTKGETNYYSYIITSPKTGLKTLADLKGHSFSFVDPASTSGNLIPRYTMTKAGLDPDKDVKGVFAGGHDASLLGVVSGKTDAGAVASDIYASLLASGKFKESDIVIIAKSDPIPNSPVAYRKELSAADKEAIKAAFFAIKDPAALKAANTGGFAPITDKTYDGLRDVAKTLNLDLTKLK
jgi:phosphonate transport system substrate-binding protein